MVNPTIPEKWYVYHPNWRWFVGFLVGFFVGFRHFQATGLSLIFRRIAIWIPRQLQDNWWLNKQELVATKAKAVNPIPTNFDQFLEKSHLSIFVFHILILYYYFYIEWEWCFHILILVLYVKWCILWSSKFFHMFSICFPPKNLQIFQASPVLRRHHRYHQCRHDRARSGCRGWVRGRRRMEPEGKAKMLGFCRCFYLRFFYWEYF